MPCNTRLTFYENSANIKQLKEVPVMPYLPVSAFPNVPLYAWVCLALCLSLVTAYLMFLSVREQRHPSKR